MKDNNYDSKMTRQATRSVGGGMANAFDGTPPIEELLKPLKKSTPKKSVEAKKPAKKAAVMKPEKVDLPKELKGLRGPRTI
jgi:hypothetical protein